MKYVLVVLLIAVFALGGALYATAAPNANAPSNAQLAAQIASLRSQVGILKSDVKWLSGYAKSLHDFTTCQVTPLWMSEQSTFSALAALYRGDPLPLRLVQAFEPKRPDCG